MRKQERRPQAFLENAAQLERMATSGRLAARCLSCIARQVRPGMATHEIHDLQMDLAREHGATPAPLNDRGFPKSICTSVNEVVCHGIPGRRRLLEGDIVGVDHGRIPRAHGAERHRRLGAAGALEPIRLDRPSVTVAVENDFS